MPAKVTRHCALTAVYLVKSILIFSWIPNRNRRRVSQVCFQVNNLVPLVNYTETNSVV